MYTLINTIEDLKILNQELLIKPYIGVDTEFRRTTKHNMRLALLQINDGEEIFLIDTIAISNPKHHSSFLYSKSVTKIFHSCKEDLEAVYSWTKQKMLNIFDTQLANSFLYDEYSISYQSIVEKNLGIVLQKNETRSNWLRRPLTDSQLKYAALDVEYLLHLYIEQREDLVSSNKIQWFYEDIEMLIHTAFNRDKIVKELKRSIPKAEEEKILFDFNKAVLDISQREKINSTLFFSKKAQKDFLRNIISYGMKEACRTITLWRKDLIEDKILEILK